MRTSPSYGGETPQIDLWLAGIQPMVTLNKADIWDEDFITLAKAGRSTVLRTKQNFLYLRYFFSSLPKECQVQMFAVKTEKLLCPRDNWISLYTDVNTKAQAVRTRNNCFLTNAHPFLLSGLYSWTGYTLVGHLGKELMPLPETIEESYFEKDLWARAALSDDEEDPYILNYFVPASALSGKRICTTIRPKDCFDTQLVTSMVFELNAKEDAQSITYNGQHGRVEMRYMIYLSLKPNATPPSTLTITSETGTELQKMEYNQKDLTFTRKYHKAAVLRDYTKTRSKMIDCGRTNTTYGPSYGGQKQWQEAVNHILKMPIPIRDPDRDPSPFGKIGTSGTEVLANEITINYPSIIALRSLPNKLDPAIENLEMLAEQRSLTAHTSRFITAAVWYGTSSAESSAAFVVQWYQARNQYLKNPGNWVSLNHSGKPAILEYAVQQPNTRSFPAESQPYFYWEDIPADSWLIAQITDTTGTMNPKPTEMILPDSWFEQQTQWAFIPTNP